MKIEVSWLTNNPCYKAGKTITVKGLMLHSVGTPQPDAKVFIKNWNSALYKRACVHAFVDGNNGTIYQTLPWNYRGWHCGSGSAGSGNNTHIGVEMCEPSSIKYTSGAQFTCSDKTAARAVVKRTYEAAVELFAYLCEKYSLDPLKTGVILSHAEGCKKGIASNHGDPEHLWQGLNTGYSMDGFRKDVNAKMKKTSGASASDKTPPYNVRVEITDLNIRKGPGTDYKKTGKCTGKGVFTIREVQKGTGSASGWGKLWSGAGWISMDYCKIL